MIAGAERAAPERAIVEAVARAFVARGYRTYVDPDGTDYFDLVVRRDREVGLVEAKVAGASEVLRQALRRRPWGDWVAVALGSERSAKGVVARTRGHRAEAVGVWACTGGTASELRAARPVVPATAEDPFSTTRDLLRRHLEELDSGALPANVRWSGVLAAVRRASGGRSFAEWRLDELADAGP